MRRRTPGFRLLATGGTHALLVFPAGGGEAYGLTPGAASASLGVEPRRGTAVIVGADEPRRHAGDVRALEFEVAEGHGPDPDAVEAAVQALPGDLPRDVLELVALHALLRPA